MVHYTHVSKMKGAYYATFSSHIAQQNTTFAIYSVLVGNWIPLFFIMAIYTRIYFICKKRCRDKLKK